MEYNAIIGSKFKSVSKPYLSVTGDLSLKNPSNLIYTRHSTLPGTAPLMAKKSNDNDCIPRITESIS
jgi:hypothetical protein